MYCAQCGYNNPPGTPYCKNCERNLAPGKVVLPRPDKPAPPAYASFRLRFFAGLLDLLLFTGFLIALILALLVIIAITGVDNFVHHDLAVPLFCSAMFSLFLAYKILMESGSAGATLGMRWMNIRVSNVHGNRLTLARAAWRLFARLFSYLTLGSGFLLQAFTTRKQALHDFLSGSVVTVANDSKQISFMATLVVLFVAVTLPALALFSTAGLPAFQQHILNVQLDKGIKIGKQAALAVSRFYRNNGRVPAALEDAGVPINTSRHVGGITLNPQNGELTLTFSLSARKGIREKHLIFSPALATDNNILWRCHSADIEARLLPEQCKQ